MLASPLVKLAYMKPPETIGDRIRRSREANDLTQEEVGQAAGITGAAISQVESGNSKSLKAEHIFDIARKLNKDPEWLVTGKGDENPKPDIVGAISELPDDNGQQTLDFIEYRWQKAEGVVASEKIVHYTKMIETFKKDLAERKPRPPNKGKSK